MRIVHLVQRFHPATGGAETYVREIALEQARRGHEVTVATTMPRARDVPGEDALVVGKATVRIVRFPTREYVGGYLFPPWLPMRGVDAFLRRTPADILHAHSYRFDTVEAAARANRRRGTPFVVSALGFYPPENALVALSRRLYDRRGGAALRRAARCVALTRDEIQHYEAMGVPRERVDVVPGGILPEAFDAADGAAFRAQHGLAGSVVLFLARLAHDKGLTDLVEAMAAGVPGAMLAVVGPDAGARGDAERIARRLGIAERVRFLGRVPDTRAAYAACDVFVHPSHYESFGLVIIEAMAQGRPVVTTTAGGMPEAAGDVGLLVPPRDPPALAAKVRALLADPALRARLGERGREHARTFLWSHVVDRIEETYGRALSSRA